MGEGCQAAAAESLRKRALDLQGMGQSEIHRQIVTFGGKKECVQLPRA
jgi:hypothetical protein